MEEPLESAYVEPIKEEIVRNTQTFDQEEEKEDRLDEKFKSKFFWNHKI